MLYVEWSLDIAWQKQEVIVVADDTDILALLLHFWNFEVGYINLQSMSKNKENTPGMFLVIWIRPL